MMTNKKKNNSKKGPCNCYSCKEIRSLDKIDRVSRWVLGTVKWTYDYGYIYGSGALNERELTHQKNLKSWMKLKKNI